MTWPTADISVAHFALAGALWVVVLGVVLVRCWRDVRDADAIEAGVEAGRENARRKRETSATGPGA